MLSPRLSSSRSTSPPAGPSESEHRGQSTQPAPPHSVHGWNLVSPSCPVVFVSPAPSHSSHATCRCPLHFGQNCIGNYVDGSKQFGSALELRQETTPLSGSASSLSRDVRAVVGGRRAIRSGHCLFAPLKMTPLQKGLLGTATRDCSVSLPRCAARLGPPPSPRLREAPPRALSGSRPWCRSATRRARPGSGGG